MTIDEILTIDEIAYLIIIKANVVLIHNSYYFISSVALTINILQLI